jgi:hypothetical protein
MSELEANFNYTEFMNNEFPKSTKELPQEAKLVEHFDRITSLLFDSANGLLKQRKESGKELVAIFENTRHTLIANYRLRSINLMRVFNEVFNVDNKSLFDEGTANIITRSLLENYLIFNYLYKESKESTPDSVLKFSLYELSSVLQFQKHADSISKKSLPVAFKKPDLEKDIDALLVKIETNDLYKKQPKKIVDSIKRIKSKKQDFLSFINFNSLIRNSPLPTNFAKDYYSYASSFAHSEGFSLTMSQMLHRNTEKWGLLNKLMKFRILTICLYTSSQFLISFIEDEKINFEDEHEQSILEVLSLSKYYVDAMNCND